VFWRSRWLDVLEASVDTADDGTHCLSVPRKNGNEVYLVCPEPDGSMTYGIVLLGSTETYLGQGLTIKAVSEWFDARLKEL
jgi:hypothetical protein